MTVEVFLDTAYAIALSSANDHFHQRAVLLANQLEAAGTRLVTTQAVLLEIGNALSKQRYRYAAIQLLDALEADQGRDHFPLHRTLHAGATDVPRTPRQRMGPDRLHVVHRHARSWDK
jgi:predicted nucleic acid-binding protein